MARFLIEVVSRLILTWFGNSFHMNNPVFDDKETIDRSSLLKTPVSNAGPTSLRAVMSVVLGETSE